MTKKMTKREMFEQIKANHNLTAEEVKFIDHELKLLAKKNSAEKKPTSVQVANECLKSAILDFMEVGQKYTITDLMKSATVLTCQSQATHIVIPEQIAHNGENYTMKRIGEYAFKNCPMQTISLPDTICTIEKNAFCFCRQLQHVRIPALVKIIPAYCFSHCTHLTAVELTEQTKWISQNAFATCFGLQSINLQHMQVIQKMAFFHCKSLQSVAVRLFLMEVQKSQ